MKHDLTSPSLGDDPFWQAVLNSGRNCPICEASNSYNLDDGGYCTKCGYDAAEAHEERKRRRLAEQQEY